MMNPRRPASGYNPGLRAGHTVMQNQVQGAQTDQNMTALKRRAMRAKQLQQLHAEALAQKYGNVDPNAMGPWAQMQVERGY